MQEVKAKEKFRNATDEQVREALNDPNPHNALAREVARLIEGYTANFYEYCEQIGGIPEKIVRINPETAVERVALELFEQVIQTETSGRAH